jgi:hypothetical protein
LEGHPLLVKDGFLNLPTGSLRAVIAGCEADYESIQAVVTTADAGLKINRAIRSPNKYRLQIVE